MLQLDYQLIVDDHVEYQLYLASISERIQKKRLRNRIIVSIVYLILAVTLFLVASYMTGVLFLIIAVLWYVFYPMRDRKRYRKHYEAFFREDASNGKSSTIHAELTTSSIHLEEENSESTIKTTAIQFIDEIGLYYFIRFAKNKAIILPKSQIHHKAAFKNWVDMVTEQHNIERNTDLNWTWK
ncbi:MAG: hypothetical protein AAGI23_12255 [Bacteroidota bacterium]